MWPGWLRRNKTNTNRRKSKSFSCSSFKDVTSLTEEQPISEPGSPRSPSIFHRVRISTSVLRSWAQKNAVPYLQPPLRLPSQSIVVYFTSLRVVRRTFEDCRTVRSILRGFRVPIDERDLSMDHKFMDELQAILSFYNNVTLTLPKVFIGGRYIGGAEEIKQLHESGELANLITGLPSVGPLLCDNCGGMRFVLCDQCSGSHKIYVDKCGFQTCKTCNVNGLIRCPYCCPEFV